MSGWQSALYTPGIASRSVPRENGVMSRRVDVYPVALPLPATVIPPTRDSVAEVLVVNVDGALELVPLREITLTPSSPDAGWPGGWASYDQALGESRAFLKARQ